MSTYRRVPMSMAEWQKRFDEAVKGSDEIIGPDGCREYLASVIALVHEAVLVVLFHDDRVKNHFSIPFGFEGHSEFNFEVCFRRKDGHFPSDRPLLDAYLQSRVDDLEERVGSLFAAIKHGDEAHQEWLRKKIEEHFK